MSSHAAVVDALKEDPYTQVGSVRKPRKVRLQMRWTSESDRSDATSTSNNRQRDRDQKDFMPEERQPISPGELSSAAHIRAVSASFSSGLESCWSR